MHEHSLAKNLAYIIFTKLNENKNLKPKRIVIVIGEASGIQKDLLEHSLKDHIFKGTPCEEAELVFKLEKPKLKCKNCNSEFSELVIRCRCNSDSFDVTAGKDVYVSEIEFY